MTAQRKQYTMDIAKLTTAIGLLAGGIYWAGKIDQKVSDIKEDVVQIKAFIYPTQPVVRQGSKLVNK